MTMTTTITTTMTTIAPTVATALPQNFFGSNKDTIPMSTCPSPGRDIESRIRSFEDVTDLRLPHLQRCPNSEADSRPHSQSQSQTQQQTESADQGEALHAVDKGKGKGKDKVQENDTEPLNHTQASDLFVALHTAINQGDDIDSKVIAAIDHLVRFANDKATLGNISSSNDVRTSTSKAASLTPDEDDDEVYIDLTTLGRDEEDIDSPPAIDIIIEKSKNIPPLTTDDKAVLSPATDIILSGPEPGCTDLSSNKSLYDVKEASTHERSVLPESDKDHGTTSNSSNHSTGPTSGDHQLVNSEDTLVDQSALATKENMIYLEKQLVALFFEFEGATQQPNVNDDVISRPVTPISDGDHNRVSQSVILGTQADQQTPSRHSSKIEIEIENENITQQTPAEACIANAQAYKKSLDKVGRWMAANTQYEAAFGPCGDRIRYSDVTPIEISLSSQMPVGKYLTVGDKAHFPSPNYLASSATTGIATPGQLLKERNGLREAVEAMNKCEVDLLRRAGERRLSDPDIQEQLQEAMEEELTTSTSIGNSSPLSDRSSGHSGRSTFFIPLEEEEEEFADEPVCKSTLALQVGVNDVRVFA